MQRVFSCPNLSVYGDLILGMPIHSLSPGAYKEAIQFQCLERGAYSRCSKSVSSKIVLLQCPFFWLTFCSCVIPSKGGVRVFEGINFMSRSPTMNEEELSAMHARAEKAGMYPYGASPEQMHQVERYPVGAAPVDNNWQQMWRAIGVDKLLELLTEAIEDGGR